GQVLPEPYPAENGCLVVREMADYLAMDLVRKGLVTDQLVLDVGYDIDNLKDPERRKQYKGPVKEDHYGRQVPAPAHGSQNFKNPTSSSLEMIEAAERIYRRVVNPSLLVRRFYLSVNRLKEEDAAEETPLPEQLSLFRDYEAETRQAQKEAARRSKERKAQETVLAIRDRFGKNAVLRGMNFEEGATARERNAQVGGHHE
ncbi:MAG: DNA methylase, partial [Lachnospiraceae bacterium]|nr:DNA methylase [Lachnospiraceae bacterium]